MPTVPRDDMQGFGESLSRALKAIRRHRRMRPAEVARSMNMALRSYEHFESGRGRVNVERIHQFAAVTDSDPFAILASLALGRPELAVRCADNKLGLIFHMALQDFSDRAGDQVARLDARTLIGAFTYVFENLWDATQRRDGFADAWMAQRANPATMPATGTSAAARLSNIAPDEPEGAAVTDPDNSGHR
jgi:transcriptional regulator with XRE-family HTH domain